MATKIRVVKFAFLLLALLWSFILAFFLGSSIYQNYQYAQDLALQEAVVSTKKDLAYRSWIASHGGVYVSITAKTPPNTYLSHIPNRDVNTTSGQQLTLMNPAYTLSQMMSDYSNLYGTKGHITSSVLLNPKNAPDTWEAKVLKVIEKSKEPFFERAFIEDKEYIRYMKPLFTEAECLKCHAFQGYKIGDIRGGVSVSIQLEPYFKEALSNSIPITFYFLIVWLAGLILISLGYDKAQKIVKEKIKDYEQSIFNLLDIIEKRDRYTAGHTKRVAEYSVMIAREMGVADLEIEFLQRACMLHDIGKVAIPDSVLLKPDRLTPYEYDIIKAHVTTGYEILEKIDIYSEIAQIVRHHHEHYDGSGYPQGLKGDEIPMLSQIMTVADAFDAMTTQRIYKPRKDVVEAIEEIEYLSGKQFHPKVASAAQKILADIQVDNLTTSQLPSSQIEEERFAYFYRDQTTQIHNKSYLNFFLQQNSKNLEYRYVCGLELHSFGEFNKLFGWKSGDELLRKVAGAIKSSLPSTAMVFSVFGDDFIIVCKDNIATEDVLKNVFALFEGTPIKWEIKYFDLKETPFDDIDSLEELFLKQ